MMKSSAEFLFINLVTTASEELAYVDTGADKLPMQIFSDVALPNPCRI